MFTVETETRAVIREEISAKIEKLSSCGFCSFPCLYTLKVEALHPGHTPQLSGLSGYDSKIVDFC